MSNKLKCCPFCGGEAKLIYINENGVPVCIDSEEELNANDICSYIHCYGCDTEIFPHGMETAKDVLEAWNTRKPIEKIKEELKVKAGKCREYNNKGMMIYENSSGRRAYLDSIEIVERSTEWNVNMNQE